MVDYKLAFKAFSRTLSPDDLPPELTDMFNSELAATFGQSTLELGAEQLAGGWLTEWADANPKKAEYIDQIENEHVRRSRLGEPAPSLDNNEKCVNYTDEQYKYAIRGMAEYLKTVGKPIPPEVSRYVGGEGRAKGIEGE